MDKPLISVIIPVYNVSDYLDRCLKSVVEQTYINLEIILVDDGSTDGGSEKCDCWAGIDSRIKVIHKSNGGLSDARNCGLNICNGEYVAFIDSDDCVLIRYVENLYKAIEKSGCNLSISSYSIFFNEQDLGSMQNETNAVDDKEIETVSSSECLKRMLYTRGTDVNAWGKLYKKSLFDGIRFPVGKLYEDIPVSYKIVDKCKNVAVIPNKDYLYFQRPDSIQNSKFKVAKLDAVEHMRELLYFVKERYPEVLKAANCRYFSVLCNVLFQINDKNYDSIKKELWYEVKKYRKGILYDSEARKKAKYAALISYFGYDFLKFVYSKTQYRGRKK